MYVFRSISDLQQDLRAGHVTCVELVQQHVMAIKNASHLNCVLETFETSALASAQRIDENIKNGKAGQLAGTIIGLKDTLCYAGHKVSAGSKILHNFESLYSATAVQRLLDADAIIIARLNCDEFAMGSSNENSAFGPVKHPLDPKRVPGGSSGGSAAAVAAGICHAALGTDTGGSIRQPAAFTGTIGLKPTYGRISRNGLIAYASSFDQIGPITKTIEDAALLFEIMSGKDAADSTTASEPVPHISKSLNDKKTPRKIGYITECVEADGIDPEVQAAVKSQLHALQAAGHDIIPISFPYLDYLVPVYYVLTTAEASSNLARFSGMHYGYRSSEAKDLEQLYKQSRSQGFGKEVKRRIMLGTFILSAGYYEAYYNKGQKVRRLVQDMTLAYFKSLDAIITPTTPGTAFEFGKNSADPIKMYLEDIFTVQANITGVPAISVPCDTHSNGMPIGIQVMCDRFNERVLFEIASQIKIPQKP